MNRRVPHFVFLPPVRNLLTGSLPTELGALSELKTLRMGKSHESTSWIDESHFNFTPCTFLSQLSVKFRGLCRLSVAKIQVLTISLAKYLPFRPI
jgi:hypothetical protein